MVSLNSLATETVLDSPSSMECLQHPMKKKTIFNKMPFNAAQISNNIALAYAYFITVISLQVIDLYTTFLWVGECFG